MIVGTPSRSQTVADATNRLDPGVLLDLVDLAANSLDVGVDRDGYIHRVNIAPEMLPKLVVAEHPSGVAHQLLHQCELGDRQADVDTPDLEGVAIHMHP